MTCRAPFGAGATRKRPSRRACSIGSSHARPEVGRRRAAPQECRALVGRQIVVRGQAPTREQLTRKVERPALGFRRRTEVTAEPAARALSHSSRRPCPRPPPRPRPRNRADRTRERRADRPRAPPGRPGPDDRGRGGRAETSRARPARIRLQRPAGAMCASWKLSSQLVFARRSSTCSRNSSTVGWKRSQRLSASGTKLRRRRAARTARPETRSARNGRRSRSAFAAGELQRRERARRRPDPGLFRTRRFRQARAPFPEGCIGDEPGQAASDDRALST